MSEHLDRKTTNLQLPLVVSVGVTPSPGWSGAPPPGADEADATDATGYHQLTPRADLAPWLAHLWVQEAKAAPAPPTTVVPNGRVELIVRYGDPFVHLEGGQIVTVPAVCALGQRTRPIVAAATGATGLVIAGLHPWAGDALLGPDVSAFTDRCVDLAEVVGRAGAASLEDEVASAARPEDRARAVEAFLGRLLREHAIDTLAVACARRIRRRAGRVSIDELATELGSSARHLRRRVTRAVGLGPKRLARLARAQEALAGLRRGSPWPEVAFECGYVDQAHLIREVKAFTGRTPCALPGPGRETPLMRSFNSGGRSPFPATVYL